MKGLKIKVDFKDFLVLNFISIPKWIGYNHNN